MNRKAASSGDSLDLLLDTICNTFGGILFIAMLVAILTNQVSRDIAPTIPSADSSRELRRMRGELTESESRLTKLRQAVRQKEDLERRFADPESLALLESLRAVDDTSDELLKDRSQKLANVAESQAELEETARELERVAQQMAEAQERLRLEKQKLETEANLRSRTSQVPRQRATQKAQIPFFLKGGRLCAYVMRDDDGQYVQNEEETRITEDESEKRFVEPVDNAGLAVPKTGSNAEIAKRLSTFDKNRHFLSIYVFSDSFAHFEGLKQEVINAGFEYNLVPFPDNAKVSIGDQIAPILVQ